MSAPPPPGSHLLVLSLDTYGDLVLRQPLLRQLLDDGQRVTLVVRPGYQDLVPFVDPRLGLFVSEVSPIGQAYVVARANFDKLMQRVNEQIGQGIERGAQSGIITLS